LAGLKGKDLAFVHVEAPDEAGHSGVLKDKMAAVEAFDAQVVGPILKGLSELGPHRVLLATDHFTPLEVRTHTTEPVPFVIWDSARPVSGGQGFNESAALAAGVMEPQAHKLVGRLIEES
jgi:2,3-bisphosphoglycerate-independent phosphoglycerate mutase